MQSETLTYSTPSLVEVQALKLPDDILTVQRIKNEVAIRLLQIWLADESGYDEHAWEIVGNCQKDWETDRRSQGT